MELHVWESFVSSSVLGVIRHGFLQAWHPFVSWSVLGVIRRGFLGL